MGRCNAKFLTVYLMLNIPPQMKTFRFSIPMNQKGFVNVNDATGTNGKSRSCHLLRMKYVLKNLKEKTFITPEHRPQGYTTFSMLNSAEHEIYPAH